MPDALAPIYTGGRGGLEACLMNTYNLPARPFYTLASLTLHECTPGHSFQAALALEGPERPPFRRGTSFSGYGEGWGLYTEWLGTIMGIYETPYEDFGRLTYEMWRACRLVIDTGIHQFGWTREQAMSYLRDRAALAEHEITTEIDRYIAWPGQALAYKLGELQIRRHRREAEEKLGAKFDQRRFHDAILAIGSVPLPVLEQRMAQFIADESATPKAIASLFQPRVPVYDDGDRRGGLLFGADVDEKALAIARHDIRPVIEQPRRDAGVEKRPRDAGLERHRAARHRSRHQLAIGRQEESSFPSWRHCGCAPPCVETRHFPSPPGKRRT